MSAPVAYRQCLVKTSVNLGAKIIVGSSISAVVESRPTMMYLISALHRHGKGISSVYSLSIFFYHLRELRKRK